jgi:hypothetical protein
VVSMVALKVKYSFIMAMLLVPNTATQLRFSGIEHEQYRGQQGYQQGGQQGKGFS